MATIPQPRPTVIDLAREIKQQYPGQFDDLPDWELGTEIKTQYPDHFGDFDDAFMQSPGVRQPPPPVPKMETFPVSGALGSLLEPIAPQPIPTPDQLVGPPESLRVGSPEDFLPEIGQGIGGAPNIPRFREPSAQTAYEEASRVGPKLEATREFVRGINPAALLPEPGSGQSGLPSPFPPSHIIAGQPPPTERDAADEFLRTVHEVFNPETVATIYALGGADKFVRGFTSHPKVLAWLKNVPVAREALRGIGEILVPGGVTAYAGSQTKEAVEKAIKAYDAGDTKAGAQHAANALLSGLVTVGGAAGTGLRVRGAQGAPTGAPPEQPAAGGGPRPSLTPPRPSLTPPRGTEVPTPEELIGATEPPLAARPARATPSTVSSSATGGRPIEIKSTGRSTVADLGFNENLSIQQVQAKLPQGATIERGPMGQIVIEFPALYSRSQVEVSVRAAIEGQPGPSRGGVLDDILGAMGAGVETAAPRPSRPSTPKVTPQPKPAEAAGLRTQAEMAPTRKGEVVQELEPPPDRGLLEEMAEAGRVGGSGRIPKPPGETQVTTGKTTRVSMGPMSESNREALSERLAGRADVSRDDDGRTLVEFDSYVDADTAALAVNGALTGPREPEPPPVESGMPLPADLVGAGQEPEPASPSIEDLIAVLPAPASLVGAESTEPRGGKLDDPILSLLPEPVAPESRISPQQAIRQETAPTPDELVGAGEAGPGRVAAGRPGAGEGHERRRFVTITRVGRNTYQLRERKLSESGTASTELKGGERQIGEYLGNQDWLARWPLDAEVDMGLERIEKGPARLKTLSGKETSIDDLLADFGFGGEQEGKQDFIDITPEDIARGAGKGDVVDEFVAEPDKQPEPVSGRDTNFKDPDYVAKAQRFGKAYREAREELPDAPLSWQEMTRLADQAFGGSIASGAYSSRDAYDALEWTEQQRLAEEFADRGNTPEDVKAAVRQIAQAGNLMPSQTARTREQVQFQQFSTRRPIRS